MNTLQDKKCIKMIIRNSTCPKVGLFLFQFGGASFCGFAAAKKFGNKQICLHTSPHFPQYRRSQQHQNRLSLKKYKRSGECSRNEKVGYSSNINWSLGRHSVTTGQGQYIGGQGSPRPMIRIFRARKYFPIVTQTISREEN